MFYFKTRTFNFDSLTKLHVKVSLRSHNTWSYRFRLLFNVVRRKRKIFLYFPAADSPSLKENTTRYNKLTDELIWHLEFLLGNRFKLKAPKTDESLCLINVLRAQFPYCVIFP